MAGMGGSMMAGIKTYGIAESGFGVNIGGFHCPTLEFQGRLEELKATLGPFQDIAQFEQEGYVTFLAMTQDVETILTKREVAVFRREPHKFFQDLPKFLASTKAHTILKMVLTGSLGSISLTILYRPVSSSV